MGIFQPIPIAWEGVEHVIPADRVMGAIAAIEDVVTLHELQQFAVRKTAPMGKLAMAYGAVLRYAGARVTDEEVYSGMLGSGDRAPSISIAIAGLLNMMIPPASIGGGAVTSGNGPGNRPGAGSRQQRRAAARSSRKRTSSSSATSG